MAREAIEQVKKAENKASAMIERAKEDAKRTVQEAEIYGKEMYRKIISDGKKEAENLKKIAKEEAQAKTRPILQEGKDQADAIRNVDHALVAKASDIVIERIVR